MTSDAARAERVRNFLIVAVDAEENQHQRRNQQDDEPRAAGELGDGEHQHDDEGADRANRADDALGLPVAVVFERRFQPCNFLARLELADVAQMDDHARLRDA